MFKGNGFNLISSYFNNLALGAFKDFVIKEWITKYGKEFFRKRDSNAIKYLKAIENL